MLKLLLILITFSSHVFAEGRIADKNIAKFLEQQGVGKNMTTQSWNNLKKVLKKLQDDEVYTLKNGHEFLQYALDMMEKSQDQEAKVKLQAFMLAKRIIYSLRANDISQGGLPAIGEILHIAYQLTSSIPYLDSKERLKPLGAKATLESPYLVDPKKPGQYVSRAQLKNMSAWQVSDLDIAAGHPAWRSQLELQTQGQKDYWKYLEELSENEIWNHYSKKKKAKAQKYSLEKARRVLFFSKIKDTATAPKIEAKDAYGEKWKVKWGLEVQTAPLASRLYVKLGARYSDLVYANEPGVEGLVLILGDPKKKSSCDNINTVKWLSYCLLESRYNFNLNPYLQEVGVIDSKNVNRILKNLAQGGDKKYSPKSLMGRRFVTFKESSVELQSKTKEMRGGPAPGDILGSLQDRVARSLVLFNMWIWNTDSKDDNNKSALVPNLMKEGKADYVEFIHDLGASLGSPLEAGNPNGLGTGRKFARFGRFLTREPKIIFDQFMLYRPRSWGKATYADTLWMAKKIVQMSNQDLQEISKSSLWPDFMQKAFVYKLAARRDQLAKLFNLKVTHSAATLPKNAGAQLKTKAQRIAWAKYYAIPVSMLEKELKRASKSHDYTDWTMVNGEVAYCSQSVIVNLLEKYHFPTGLTRRVDRRSDDEPLAACSFAGR